MTIGNKLTIAVVAAALGALIAPAFAQSGSSDMQIRPVQVMSMGHMVHDMMSGGIMAGCAEIMQSMNNGGSGRLNNQWQKQRRSESD